MCRRKHFGNCDPETADQEYCIFHKPNKSEEEAMEFYRKFFERFKPRIEEIEVEDESGQKRKIKRFVFEKPVDARGFVFPEIPEEPIEYKDTEGNKWDQRFLFEYVVFENKAFFNKAIFEGDISFKQADFKMGADFIESTFLGHANFSNVVFHKDAQFSEANFKSICSFFRATFKEQAKFKNCIVWTRYWL